MYISTLLTAAAALFIGAEAGIMLRQDPYALDFRIWSERGCGRDSNNGNLGVWTITQSQTGVCQPTFNAPDDIVKGIYLNPPRAGCSMVAYTAHDCQEGGQLISEKTCAEPTESDPNWLSFKVTCASE